MVNGLGGFVTGVTVLVVLVAKFVDGAWITVLFIPMLIFFFAAIRRHYHSVALSTRCTMPVVPGGSLASPVVIVPIDRWSQITKQGLELASRLSSEIIAVHVDPEEHSELLQEDWDRYVVAPFRDSGETPPKLITLPSPYRFVIIPLVQYILELSAKHPDRPHRGRDSRTG